MFDSYSHPLFKTVTEAIFMGLDVILRLFPSRKNKKKEPFEFN
jgi:hypothetical protein